jgi:hypothetical protein
MVIVATPTLVVGVNVPGGSDAVKTTGVGSQSARRPDRSGKHDSLLAYGAADELLPHSRPVYLLHRPHAGLRPMTENGSADLIAGRFPPVLSGKWAYPVESPTVYLPKLGLA